MTKSNSLKPQKLPGRQNIINPLISNDIVRGEGAKNIEHDGRKVTPNGKKDGEMKCSTNQIKNCRHTKKSEYNDDNLDLPKVEQFRGKNKENDNEKDEQLHKSLNQEIENNQVDDEEDETVVRTCKHDSEMNTSVTSPIRDYFRNKTEAEKLEIRPAGNPCENQLGTEKINLPAGNCCINLPAGNCCINLPAGNCCINIPAGNCCKNLPAGNCCINLPARNCCINLPAGNCCINFPAGNCCMNQENNQSSSFTNSENLEEEDEKNDHTSTDETENSDQTSNEKYDKKEDTFKYFSEEFITVMYANVDQSVTGKMNEILGVIDSRKPDIILLTEIEPKCKKDPTKIIKESEISIQNYSLFLNEKRKRGIAVYINKKLNPRDCTKEINENFEECVFCEFESINEEKILIGCMYKSPNSSKENVENMCKTIKSDKIEKYDVVCIAGDFNYPRIRWAGRDTPTGENEIFLETVKDAYLVQKVIKPTRNVRVDQQANLIDLVLVNKENAISDIVHSAPIGKSDHDSLFFQLYIDKDKQKKQTGTRYNLGKGDYDAMRKEMKKTNWDKIDDKNVEEAWGFIKDTLIQNMNTYIPKSNIKENTRTSPCWMNQKVFRKIKKKYFAYKRFLITRQGRDYEKYIRERNSCKKEIKKAKKKHEKNIAHGCKENPTKFWQYVNQRCKTNVGISSLKDKEGNLKTTDKERADILNEFFTSVFLKENMNDLPKIEEGSFSKGIKIDDIQITEKAVEKKLKELNPQKAQGPDKIPPRVLKELHKELAKPLAKLFRKSLECGEIPEDWKFAEVTAIFKKGNKTDPGNYRPVSLTCICCKLMEQFIRDTIVNHMTDEKLYSDSQHGFRKNRSCVTQLLEVYDELTERLDEGKNIDIIYLDFKKAFDSIPHERLLLKMKGYGITGKILNWVRDFLSNRKQKVRVGDEYSKESNVTSGIPQGSILGPVLFTIFINDLPDDVNTSCKVFADDTKIYDDTSNHIKIQEDLYSMQKWTEKWNLYFNVQKCKVMHIGKNNPQTKYFMKLESSRQELEKCSEEKDLGITFDPTLNFDIHIDNITKKANQMLGIIRRTFSYMDKSIFQKLYKALVRSHLEYGNVIWYPHLKRQSIQIEKIQRRATKLVPECKDLTYDKRLKLLNLFSLKGRRVRGDLIQVYKIFQGIDDIDSKKLLPLSTYHSTRNQGFKLRKRHCKKDIRKYSFTNRVVEIWNEIPSDIKNAATLNSFKNRIDKNKKLVKLFYEFDE